MSSSRIFTLQDILPSDLTIYLILHRQNPRKCIFSSNSFLLLTVTVDCFMTRNSVEIEVLSDSKEEENGLQSSSQVTNFQASAEFRSERGGLQS